MASFSPQGPFWTASLADLQQSDDGNPGPVLGSLHRGSVAHTVGW